MFTLQNSLDARLRLLSDEDAVNLIFIDQRYSLNVCGFSASCTYAEYCTTTKHVKMGKKATQGTGKLKNKKVITCHANNLHGLSDLKFVIST